MCLKNKITGFIRQELTGWKTEEVLWLIFCCGIIFVLSVYCKDSVMGIISAITGIVYVICNGKGKRSAFIFGMVNSLLYAIISYKARFYGEVMLNGFYYFPMEFYGIYVWNKHINTENFQVEKRKMKPKQRGLLCLCILVSTAAYGYIIKLMGGNLPFVDALSTVISVFAMVVSIKMYIEQWLLWFVVDAVTIVMWAIAYAQGNDSIATLVMWILYLINAVVMYISWRRDVVKELKGA